MIIIENREIVRSLNILTLSMEILVAPKKKKNNLSNCEMQDCSQTSPCLLWPGEPSPNRSGADWQPVVPQGIQAHETHYSLDSPPLINYSCWIKYSNLRTDRFWHQIKSAFGCALKQPREQSSVLSPALCPNSHRYGPTSFQSDHHAGQCWLVECVTWVRFHRSSECCRTCWIWAQLTYIYLLSAVT